MIHSFGSDNHSGVHPLILKSIIEHNNNYSVAYGEDKYTLDVLNKLEKILGENCKAFFVCNGTGANVVALSAFVKSFNSILSPDTAHINVDECGAPEKISGAKIIPLASINGKVTKETVKDSLVGFGFQHHSQPRILSISQPTELGTIYTPDEIKDLAELMHSHNCFLHVDGSRISNAAAYLDKPIKEFITDCNVDVLSFGGTKNGLLMGEAVIVFKNDYNKNHYNEIINSIPYIRKQATQLYSKNRFIAAQFDAYLNNSLYIELAKASNNMAKYLGERLKEIKEIKISRPIESNAVFAIISKELTDHLLKKHYFYTWDEKINEVRWMCSFSTTKSDIDSFINDIITFYK